MKTPTEYELRHGPLYDPIKAHQYYERTKKLKGRRRGRGEEPRASGSVGQGLVRRRDPRTGKQMGQIHREAKAKQKKELSQQINRLQDALKRLEARIRKLEHEEASEDRKGEAKKERAAKERDKPKSAAEKAEASRENKKYREKHQQEQKSKKDSKSDDGDSKKKTGSNAHKISELKSLATKKKGQLAVAKQKLAAL